MERERNFNIGQNPLRFGTCNSPINIGFLQGGNL